MSNVWVRVIEFQTEEKRKFGCPFLVEIDMFSTQHPSTNQVINKGANGIWIFKTPNQQADFLTINFIIRHPFKSNERAGTLILPLNWFPVNHVVREWYPLTLQGSSKQTMICLEVHIDNRKSSRPFMAAFSNLRVTPSWQRPTDSENSDYAAPPQIAYVVREPVPNSTDGMEQFRIIQAIQYPGNSPDQYDPNTSESTDNDATPVVLTMPSYAL